ncbi:Sau3AI family type II restriction endonuclease [Alkalibacterium iburiense]|uniref:Sau3AI family type II restriction endonuclease n=1 Tax=Alkalibacterium iburiense TaxID=290589 RepID=A0ABN0X1B4_9LACT
MPYSTEEEVMEISKSVIGKTFGEIDKYDRSSIKTKGAMGHVIEESLFDYAINSNQEADFSELGIELKVTPVKTNKNKTVSAKERLVLNIINYMTEVNQNFETSSFWLKNRRLLFFFYLWKKELAVKDYQILETLLYTYPEEDLEIIKNDWKIIHTKIKEGKAHELSEGDTMYLGACTKGSSAKSVRKQPNSDIPAKQRAYSLKQSYMTSLVRKHFNAEDLVRISNAQELKHQSFDQILEKRFKPYYGKTLEEIAKSHNLQINQRFKSKVQQVVSSILGITGTKLSSIEEFSKANIQFKTIRLEPNGLPKEHMSFEQIDFNKWLNQPFDESQIYNKFETTKFLFVVFEYIVDESNEKKLVLKGIKLWNMPEETILNEVQDLWYEVRKILTEGVKLKNVKWGNSYRVENNFPGQDYNRIVHIRPKARDGKDKTKLPDGQYVTKQTYWLDRRYISEIVKDLR